MRCTKHKHTSDYSSWRCALNEDRRKDKRRAKLANGILPENKVKHDYKMRYYPKGRQVSMGGIAFLVFAESTLTLYGINTT